MSDELRLSVSKTKTFIDCKKKFNYIYNLKLPKKDRDYHIFGKFCHKVLEDFHMTCMQNSEKPNHVIMLQAFKNAVVEYPSMTVEMKKEAHQIISQYLKIITNDKKNNLSANVLACEKNFQYLIENKVLLNGMIDRIQIDADNIVHVADYKTTKNKKYLKEDWFQLLTYAFILFQEDPNLEIVRGSYILLRHDFEYITREFSRQEAETIRDKYLSYAEQILSEQNFEANPTYLLCRLCDFSEDICPEGKKILAPSEIYGEINW